MQETEIKIDLSKPIGTINKNIYGHFAEHLGRCIYDGFWVGNDSNIPNTNGIRNDLVDALKEIKVPVLRWPGGCFADDYHWRDGIGPKEKRPRRYNRHWDDVETNEFGTHEFLELCDMLGCEPYICGNVGSGTVREMSDWIEYLTCKQDTTLARERAENGRKEPYSIKYWGVGNENWGCGGSMTPQYYANEYTRYASYTTSLGDPLFRIACGANAFDYNWTENFFGMISGKLCKCSGRTHLVNGYAFHYYCSTGSSATKYSEMEWYATLMKAVAMEELIDEHRAIMDKYDPQRRVGLICDEWGTWHKPEETYNPKWLYQQNTIRDAVIAGTTLNIFNNKADKIVMTNIAQIVNVLQAMALTEQEKLVLTPTYHVFKLYVPHQDATALNVNINTPEVSNLGVEQVSASCSIKDDKIALSLVNCAATDTASISVSFLGDQGYEMESWEFIHGNGDIMLKNTFEEPNAIKIEKQSIKNTIELLPTSVNTLMFKKK